jgi:capsular exopolysaccharide synthesis family protein
MEPTLASVPPFARKDLEPGEDEIDLSRWLDALRRHRRLLITITLSVLVVGVVLYLITPRQYRATTIIQIERPGTADSIDEVLGAASYWDAQTFYPTQCRLLESRGLAERVVRELGLGEDPAFNPVRGRLFGLRRQDEATAADDDAALGALARHLLDDVVIKPVRNTRLVEISYIAPDPELAARIANGVAEAYIDWGIETRSETVGRASSFLDSQIEEVKREIADKEAQLQAYSRRSDIVALDPTSNVVVQRLEALNKDYIEAVSRRISAEAEFNEVSRAPAETVADTFSGGLIAQLRSELLELEQEYATQLNTYKPEWPAMVELEAKIDKGRQHVQTVVDEMVEKARDSARTAYQTARRREQSLVDELTRQKNEAMLLNSAAVEYNNLLVEVSTRRALLDDLVRKMSETGVANRLQGTRTSNVLVVDRALVPVHPHRPSLPRNLAIGLVLGLVLGAGAVALVELLDRAVRTPEDLERLVNLPVLGVVPDIERFAGASYAPAHEGGQASTASRRGVSRAPRTAAADAVAIDLLPLQHPRTAASEAYRALRTAILLSIAGGPRSVVVTSAVPKEGKSATAANLAVVMAQLGHKVLLVDADLRRPRLHEVFKLSNRRGLVSYLTSTVEPAEIALPTQVENLYLTPAGPTPPNPAELLASGRMKALAKLAGERFDFVVYDSPPVVAVTDATILGSLADGVLLCVGAGRVNREDVVAALNRLAQGEVRLLGVVLNRVLPDAGTYGARYQRYAAYRYDDKTETEAADRPGATAAM